MKKRIFSTLMALVMVVGLLPTTVLAADGLVTEVTGLTMGITGEASGYPGVLYLDWAVNIDAIASEMGSNNNISLQYHYSENGDDYITTILNFGVNTGVTDTLYSENEAYDPSPLAFWDDTDTSTKTINKAVVSYWYSDENAPSQTIDVDLIVKYVTASDAGYSLDYQWGGTSNICYGFDFGDDTVAMFALDSEGDDENDGVYNYVHTDTSTKIYDNPSEPYLVEDGSYYIVVYTATEDNGAYTLTLTKYPLTINFEETSTDDDDSDYEYTVNEDGTTATITGYTGEETEIEIPDTIGGYTVTYIGVDTFDSVASTVTSITIPATVTGITTGAFNDCTALTAINVDSDNTYYYSENGVLFSGSGDTTTLVRYPIGKTDTSYTVPESVKTLGWYAFSNCKALQTVTLQEGLETISKYSFYYCENLTSMNIPSTVSSITIPFQYCASISAYTVSSGSEYFCAVDGVLFDYAKETLIQYPMNSTTYTSYTIPDGVKTISEKAFMGYGGKPAISEIVAPSSVTSVETYAFGNLSALTIITFYSLDTVFAENVFHSTTNVTIYGYENSTAAVQAAACGLTFSALDDSSGDGGDDGSAVNAVLSTAIVDNDYRITWDTSATDIVSSEAHLYVSEGAENDIFYAADGSANSPSAYIEPIYWLDYTTSTVTVGYIEVELYNASSELVATGTTSTNLTVNFKEETTAIDLTYIGEEYERDQYQFGTYSGYTIKELCVGSTDNYTGYPISDNTHTDYWGIIPLDDDSEEIFALAYKATESNDAYTVDLVKIPVNIVLSDDTGDSGDDTPTTYAITTTTATNGSFTVTATTAAADTTITITPTPATGYEVDTITVTGASGAVTVTDNTFTMPAEAVTVTVTFKETAKTAQTITLGTIGGKTYGDSSFELSATASGTGTVTFSSSNETVISISGTTATVVGAGSATITVTIAEDETYASASDSEIVTVAKATPSYTLPTDLTADYGDTLGDIDLGTGFAFVDDGTTSVGPVGTKTFAVTYTPTDTNNYNVVTGLSVSVEVAATTATGTAYLTMIDEDGDGALGEGDQLCAYYSSSVDDETVSAYQWYKNDEGITDATSATYTLGSCETGDSYYCEVTLAGNTVGTATSSTLTVGATAPAAPVIAASAGNGQVTITWETPDNGGSALTDYVLSVGTGGVYTDAYTFTDMTMTNYTVTELSNGTAYTFKLIVTNAIGEAESNEVTATPYTSSSSGSSSSSSSSSATDSSTTTNDDGSVTSSASTSTSTSGSTSTATVTDSNMESAIESAVEAADGETATVEIAVTTKSSTDTVSAVISVEAATSVADSDVAALVVSSDIGTLEISSDALAEIASQAGESDVTITIAAVDPATTLNETQQAVVGEAPVFDFSITSGDGAISSFGGAEIVVTLPYTLQDGENAENIVVWYIDDLGNITPMETVYDEETGAVTFITTHFSVYAIVHDTNMFADVDVNAYYYNAVLWAVENGITSGKTETTFAPSTVCTRAQAVTFLWRATGEPEATIDNPFSDVEEGTYYYDAVLWAVEQGITSGYADGTFAPNASCTRGQIVTFLYRLAGEPEVSGEAMSDVVDGAYYYDAVLWAVENGITTGYSDGTFAPTTLCNRGQIVTFLYRCLA